MNTTLLRGVIDPLSMLNDYLNIVFNVVVSLCKYSPRVHMGKTLTCCNSLPVCNKSFLTRKEYAICRFPRQIETHSLGWLEGLKMKLN